MYTFVVGSRSVDRFEWRPDAWREELSRSTAAIFGVLAVVGALDSVALPQPGGVGGGTVVPTCLCPEPVDRPYNCALRRYTETSEQYLGTVEFSTVYDRWVDLPACACRLILPGEGPCPPEDCDSNTVAFSETSQTCWECSVVFKLGESTALVGKLLEVLGVEVDIGGKLTDCKSTTGSYSWTVRASQCLDKHYRIARTRRQVTGYLHVTKNCEWWVREHDGMAWYWAYPCGTSECEYDTSEARAWYEFSIALQHAPFSCEAPTGDPTLDEYDNVREMPCCRPISPCDEEVEVPCCGCVS